MSLWNLTSFLLAAVVLIFAAADAWAAWEWPLAGSIKSLNWVDPALSAHSAPLVTAPVTSSHLKYNSVSATGLKPRTARARLVSVLAAPPSRSPRQLAPGLCLVRTWSSPSLWSSRTATQRRACNRHIKEQEALAWGRFKRGGSSGAKWVQSLDGKLSLMCGCRRGAGRQRVRST